MNTKIKKKISTKSKMFFGVACGFFAALLFASIVQAQNLAGEWSGLVYQTGPGDHRESYHAEMILNGSSGSMDYPELHCGGQLTFLNKKENIYYYRESITYGRDKCIDGGMIAVEPSGNSVQWAWNITGVTVTGVLTGSRRLPSCAECDAARNRCFTGCDSAPTLQDKNACINKCNHEYTCVIGYDCK